MSLVIHLRASAGSRTSVPGLLWRMPCSEDAFAVRQLGDAVDDGPPIVSNWTRYRTWSNQPLEFALTWGYRISVVK